MRINESRASVAAATPNYSAAFWMFALFAEELVRPTKDGPLLTRRLDQQRTEVRGRRTHDWRERGRQLLTPIARSAATNHD